MIIRRYLNQQILSALLAVLLVLLLIFIAQQAVRYINYAADGRISPNVMLPLLGVTIPYLLVLLLPLSLYVAMFIVYSRLYADNEMAILYLAGLGVRQLLLLTYPLVLLVSLSVMILAFWLNPWLANAKDRLIKSSITEKNIIKTLMPGRFQLSGDKRRVVYVESINKQHKVSENLFIAEDKSVLPTNVIAPREQIIIAAAQGSAFFDNKLARSFVMAKDGYRYDGIPGQNAYKIIKFKTYTVHIPDTVIVSDNYHQEGLSLQALWLGYNQPRYAAELQWRCSLWLMPWVLSLLALPLSRVKPRHSRYLLALPLLIIYIIYVNLLLVAKHLLESTITTAFLGLWWVHLIFLTIAIYGLLSLRRSYY
jgi:lipopolysaccharide export system permease protein